MMRPSCGLSDAIHPDHPAPNGDAAILVVVQINREQSITGLKPSQVRKNTPAFGVVRFTRYPTENGASGGETVGNRVFWGLVVFL